MLMDVSWFVYIIEYRNSFLYTGITTDFKRRFEEHQTGGKKAAKALKGKGPLKLVFLQKMQNRSHASKAEHLIKKLTKDQKNKIINQGFFDFDKEINN